MAEIEAYKGIVLLKRREGMSRDDILKWALEEHAHYGKSVESILRYTSSFVVAPGPRYDYPKDNPPFDLVHEIWCKDRASLDQAYAELAAKGGPVHSLNAVSQRISLLAEEYRLK